MLFNNMEDGVSLTWMSRISVEAPQIAGWVQTLLPELPKSKNGVSAMVGPFSK